MGPAPYVSLEMPRSTSLLLDTKIPKNLYMTRTCRPPSLTASKEEALSIQGLHATRLRKAISVYNNRVRHRTLHSTCTLFHSSRLPMEHPSVSPLGNPMIIAVEGHHVLQTQAQDAIFSTNTPHDCTSRRPPPRDLHNKTRSTCTGAATKVLPETCHMSCLLHGDP